MISRRTALLGLAASAAPASAFAAEPNALQQAMSGKPVPGMGAISIRNFRVEREFYEGVRRIGGRDIVTPRDRWLLASDSKAMTATMVARLVEHGVLSWEAPLERMLPNIAPSMRDEYRDVTLVDLLSHRSGLPENARDMDFLLTFVNDAASHPAQRQRYAAAALSDPPVGPKRARAAYSNSGYILAGAIAEHATGEDYRSLMATHVFNPLGMRSATFVGASAPHDNIGHVERRVADQPTDPNPPVYDPSNGVRLTVRDWSRFCIDQMQGEHGRGRLLPTPNYRMLHTRQGEGIYGLGWEVRPSFRGRTGPALLHSGSDGNWYAVAALFPNAGDGALVVANAAYGMDGNTAGDAALGALAADASTPAPAQPQ